MQHLGEQQACGAAADDRDLSFHRCSMPHCNLAEREFRDSLIRRAPDVCQALDSVWRARSIMCSITRLLESRCCRNHATRTHAARPRNGARLIPCARMSRTRVFSCCFSRPCSASRAAQRPRLPVSTPRRTRSKSRVVSTCSRVSPAKLMLRPSAASATPASSSGATRRARDRHRHVVPRTAARCSPRSRSVTDSRCALALITHTRQEFLFGAAAFRERGIPVAMHRRPRRS